MGGFAHLFIEEFTKFLLDGINELHLTRGEAHQELDALRSDEHLVEVMARWKRTLVHPFVDWFCEIGCL